MQFFKNVTKNYSIYNIKYLVSNINYKLVVKYL